MSFKASAPGSLMLLGEYAVLRGHCAVVCAIDKFIHVEIKPRSDKMIHIHSSLGELKIHLNALEAKPPFEYVITALQRFQPLPTGCDMVIEAEFSSTMGLGSSAAVTVAMLLALHRWVNQRDPTKESLWADANPVIQRVNGKGSGADLAASIFGGVIAFENEPLQVTRLAEKIPISVIYSGNKVSTHEAIDRVEIHRKQSIDSLNDWNQQMGKLAKQGINAILSRDWKTLGGIFNQAQHLMKTLTVSTPLLDTLCKTLEKQADIYGAKISGSGFGDCVIGLGELTKPIFPENEQQRQHGVQQLLVNVTSRGVYVN